MKRVAYLLVLVCACSGAPLPDDVVTPPTRDAAIADAQKPKDASASDAADASTVDATEDEVDAGPEEDASVPDVGVDTGKASCSSNSDCSLSEYCEKGEKNCGGSGHCEVTPKICAKIYLPVCGCDGKDYNNACESHVARASVSHTGACP